MEKQKTVIQELIEYVNKRPLTKIDEIQSAQIIPYGEIVNLAKELLELEKQQIKDAYMTGQFEGVLADCETYYNETFETK